MPSAFLAKIRRKKIRRKKYGRYEGGEAEDGGEWLDQVWVSRDGGGREHVIFQLHSSTYYSRTLVINSDL